MTTKILTQAQAEAVYNAMCHLNNVGGRMEARMTSRSTTTLVEESAHGLVKIKRKDELEIYPNQSAFAEAYGLQHG